MGMRMQAQVAHIQVALRVLRVVQGGLAVSFLVAEIRAPGNVHFEVIDVGVAFCMRAG